MFFTDKYNGVLRDEVPYIDTSFLYTIDRYEALLDI